jgi:hypothetical protein
MTSSITAYRGLPMPIRAVARLSEFLSSIVAWVRGGSPGGDTVPAGPEEFGAGDVIASRTSPVSVSKILHITRLPHVTIAHVRLYRPKCADIGEAARRWRNETLPVLVGHAPIDGSNYNSHYYELIGREAVTAEEFESVQEWSEGQ